MNEVITFLAGAKIDVLTIIACFMYAVHRKWLVLGREYEREVARGDKAETALIASNERELKANEAAVKTAGLVPDLLKLAIRPGEANQHASKPEY